MLSEKGNINYKNKVGTIFRYLNVYHHYQKHRQLNSKKRRQNITENKREREGEREKQGREKEREREGVILERKYKS